jgi:hypothetical protein
VQIDLAHAQTIACRSQSSDAASATTQPPKVKIQKQSPFSNINSAKVHEQVDSLAVSQSTFVQLLPESAMETLRESSRHVYKAQEKLLPPFNHYVPVRRNVPVGDDKNSIAIPYFGDDVSVDEAYAQAEVEIAEREEQHRELNRKSEMANYYEVAVSRLLENLGIRKSDVLYYLLDSNDKDVPSELPLVFQETYLNRASYLDDDYYADEVVDYENTEDNGRSNTPEAQERWQLLFRTLKRPNSRKLALAGLSCAAFQNLTMHSLWQNVKPRSAVNHEDLSRLSKQKEEQLTNEEDSIGIVDVSKGSDTYGTLACPLCFM